MKKLSVSVTAAVVAGLCLAAPAEATCDPIHDPGTGCSSTFHVDLYEVLPGATALVKGSFVDKTPNIKAPSFIKDTADDGLDAYLWVRYFSLESGGYDEYRTVVGSASGVGVSSTVEWLAPHQMSKFRLRVCLGPGETTCSPWQL